MKINDKITLSIAAAVSDVLEGKKKYKEEAKYPHDMFHPETGEKEVAKDEAEHKALSKKGYTHDKPEVDEVAEPVAKGEKEFKAKHTVKKSGMKDDGTNMKEAYHADDEDEKKDVKKEGNKFTMALNAARKNGDDTFVVSGKKYKVEDYDKKDEKDKEEVEEAKSKFPKSLVKKASEVALKMGGNMTGAAKKIEKMKKGLSDDPEVRAALQLANEEVEAHKMNEAEDNKAKYKAFFDKALKKFGVDSPAELKGDKKKEFFDYVDKNYNSEEEPGKDGVNEDVKRAAKEYANSVAKLETLRKNISDTQSSKFQMKSGGQAKIDGWKKNIENEKKYMQKLKDKFGSGVTKSDTGGFSGGA